MLLFFLAYCAGILTILSPCILPILPFVFSRADQSFLKHGLPLLLSMAVTFTVIAFLGVQGGAWIVEANQYGRVLALSILFFLGCTLLFKPLAEIISKPFVALGNRFMSAASVPSKEGFHPSSLLIGMATGLLWAPCAGPILGLILTGAALQGATAHTAILLLSYALGAVSSIALALFAGRKVFQALKQKLGVGEWLRKGLGFLVIAGVITVGTGLDTAWLTKFSFLNTNVLEHYLLQQSPKKFVSHGAGKAPATGSSPSLPSVSPILSRLNGATHWIAEPGFQLSTLKNKVILVDFWTYSCINCLRSLPYIQAWAEKYKPYGLIVVGVHTPEFAFEKEVANVRRAIRELNIHYPVAIDNRYAIWQAFQNEYWPAHYFIDHQGRIRDQHFGEGGYAHSEQLLQQLLKEKGGSNIPQTLVTEKDLGALKGVQSASDQQVVQSPETYLGYERAEHFASGSMARDKGHDYIFLQSLELNQWGLSGTWLVQGEKSIAQQSHNRLRFKFHARDLHLVMGAQLKGHPVRFKVTLDGHAPGKDHGSDCDAQGLGQVFDERLYQLIRQSAPVHEHLFEIEFFDPGVEVFAFTFG